MPGVGKTTIGKLLSKNLNIKHIDIDRSIEINESQKINDLIAEKGEEAFRILEKKALSFAIHSKELAIVSTGGGVILDQENNYLIKNQAYVVHIKSSVEEISNRINVDSRPLLYNTNKSKALCSLWQQREKLYNDVAKITIDIKGLSIDMAAQKIYSRLSSVS